VMWWTPWLCSFRTGRDFLTGDGAVSGTTWV
jgi:hypothetical protein